MIAFAATAREPSQPDERKAQLRKNSDQIHAGRCKLRRHFSEEHR